MKKHAKKLATIQGVRTINRKAQLKLKGGQGETDIIIQDDIDN